MKTQQKRVAYLAPELPSLSATFVSNEIWAMEDMGVEVCPYSIHQPNHKAHGEKAEKLALRTKIIYAQSLMSSVLALGELTFKHTRSSVRGFGQLFGDLIKTGMFTKQSAKLGYQFLQAAWLAKDLRVQNVEHLHIHFAHVPTQVGMYAAALAGVPFTFMAHANDIFERPLLIKEKIKRAKKAVTISHFNIDLMTRQGGDPNKMSIVRCGVHPTEELTQKPGGKDKTRFVIGTLGRLVEKKGVDTLIQAGALLKEKQISFRIEIAGDGPLLKDLEQQVEDAGLLEQIVFLGSMPHDKALNWMKDVDAFVLAGKKNAQGDMDGIPVVLMEAINFGIPVLSTYLSGIPELVIHKKTGLLSKPEDAEALANNIISLANSSKLVGTLVSEAKNHLRAEFDQNLNASRLLSIINNPQM